MKKFTIALVNPTSLKFGIVAGASFSQTRWRQLFECNPEKFEGITSIHFAIELVPLILSRRKNGILDYLFKQCLEHPNGYINIGEFNKNS